MGLTMVQDHSLYNALKTIIFDQVIHQISTVKITFTSFNRNVLNLKYLFLVATFTFIRLLFLVSLSEGRSLLFFSLCYLTILLNRMDLLQVSNYLTYSLNFSNSFEFIRLVRNFKVLVMNFLYLLKPSNHFFLAIQISSELSFLFWEANLFFKRKQINPHCMAFKNSHRRSSISCCCNNSDAQYPSM